jgi:hypothetical protein
MLEAAAAQGINVTADQLKILLNILGQAAPVAASPHSEGADRNLEADPTPAALATAGEGVKRGPSSTEPGELVPLERNVRRATPAAQAARAAKATAPSLEASKTASALVLSQVPGACQVQKDDVAMDDLGREAGKSST